VPFQLQVEDDDDIFTDHLTLWRFLGDGSLPGGKDYAAGAPQEKEARISRKRAYSTRKETYEEYETLLCSDS